MNTHTIMTIKIIMLSKKFYTKIEHMLYSAELSMPEVTGRNGMGRGRREGLQRHMRQHLRLMDICSLS